MNDIKLIGVGGYARAGKDTFVKIASNILAKNGYATKKFAFADALKADLNPWLREKYGISAWTIDDNEKPLIRPMLVAHGCAKRNQTQGKYWVDKVDASIKQFLREDIDKPQQTVLFISDVRFVNEADWVHSLGGKVVHLKKYSVDWITTEIGPVEQIWFDKAPNEEEEKNDPLLQKKCDVFLKLKNISNGNIITEEALLNDSYLNKEITLCLSKFPFLNIRTQ